MAQQRADNEDYRGALELFESIAADGHVEAYSEIGLIHERGTGGVSQDLDKAAQYYQRAIDNFGCPYAHARLGGLYYNGRGVPRDKRTAFHDLQKGESANDPGALIMLGLYFLLGVETQTNLQRARQLFRNAADQGCVLAMFCLANTEWRARKYLAALQWRVRATVEAFRIALRHGTADRRLDGLTEPR